MSALRMALVLRALKAQQRRDTAPAPAADAGLPAPTEAEPDSETEETAANAEALPEPEPEPEPEPPAALRLVPPRCRPGGRGPAPWRTGGE